MQHLKSIHIMKQGSHWHQNAPLWDHFGSPLRPCAEDLLWMLNKIQHLSPANPSTLLLGVTPEIACLNWPKATQLIAIDNCFSMIERIWPHNKIQVSNQAISANWLQLPLKSHSVDLIIGDGVTVFFSHPDAIQNFFQEMHRVLKPSGNFLLRPFIKDPDLPTTRKLHDNLKQGRIGNFHSYKWQLAMSLQTDITQGVRLQDIWFTWQRYCKTAEATATLTGWPIEEIRTIDSYQYSSSQYYYPSLFELKNTCSNYFTPIEIAFPSYELGTACPHIQFQPVICSKALLS